MSTSKPIKPDTALRFIKGVGPAKASKLQRKGIYSVIDALLQFPRRYEDRRKIYEPSELTSDLESKTVCVKGIISGFTIVPLRNRKMARVSIRGQSGGTLECNWFNLYKGMKNRFESGKEAIFTGQLRQFRNQWQITHPDVEFNPNKSSLNSIHYGRIVPIYSVTEGITQKWYRELIAQISKPAIEQLPELLPASVLKEFQLPQIAEAITEIHWPQTIPNLHAKTTKALPSSIRRSIFQEFFLFQLGLMQERQDTQIYHALQIANKSQWQKIVATLPFKLTNAQTEAISTILIDLQKSIAMNRILQGDVGCGKTLVALLTASEAMLAGGQVALMVPTEILAEQHFKEAAKLFDDSQIGFLSGSLSAKEKKSAYEKIASGQWKLTIGTHALIQKAVKWQNLVYAIIDEQHRFGVKQRAYFRQVGSDGKVPHLLTMTATPIPRSLALTAFGELDVTTINELPPGRQAIVTKVLNGNERNRLYKLILREAAKGYQAYIVYPLVDDSDKDGMENLKSVTKEFNRLQKGPLSNLRLAYTHGKQSADERQQIMNEFKNHKYDVLISTTVIEVGVNVPNAVVMGIENAERFGLSQLHQLRGRVGRGDAKSFCVLCTDIRPKLTEEDDEDHSTWTRLQTMEASQDGFYIAEQDLKIRGPGEFLGTRQSGSLNFQLADLNRDKEFLEQAQKAAISVYKKDPDLSQPENKNLADYFQNLREKHSDTLKSG